MLQWKVVGMGGLTRLQIHSHILHAASYDDI